jgi:hypothetical protein
MRHPPRTLRPKILAVGSIAVTASVEIWTCNGGSNQKWFRS